MGLFTRRKSRATRRAEAKAIKAKAKLEARLSARNETRRIKSEGKRERMSSTPEQGWRTSSSSTGSTRTFGR